MRCDPKECGRKWGSQHRVLALRTRSALLSRGGTHASHQSPHPWYMIPRVAMSLFTYTIFVFQWNLPESHNSEPSNPRWLLVLAESFVHGKHSVSVPQEYMTAMMIEIRIKWSISVCSDLPWSLKQDRWKRNSCEQALTYLHRNGRAKAVAEVRYPKLHN